jgi:hypothetical protein
MVEKEVSQRIKINTTFVCPKPEKDYDEVFGCFSVFSHFQTLSTLRDELLQKLMKGELGVKGEIR